MTEPEREQEQENPGVVAQAGLASASATVPPLSGPEEDED